MKMKKIINVALIAICAIAIASCNEDDGASVNVTLNKDIISIVIGTQETLTATVTPTASVTWVSSNPEVATVENGIVKAISVGRTVVNAKAGGSSAVCDVIVTVVPVPVQQIKLKKNELILAVGDKDFLGYDFVPFEATQRKVRWSSDNGNVATVHPTTGEIVAVALGKATITVTTLDGGKTDKCVVNVSPDLTLLSPVDKANVSLSLFNPEQTIKFQWLNYPEIPGYILKIADKPDFENVIFTKESTTATTEVNPYSLNDAVKDRTSNPVSIYWTVEAKSSDFKVITKTNTLNVFPDRHDYLPLVSSTASGMTVTKQTAPYQYSLSTSGTASVNTAGLTRALHVDSIVFCFMYKSDVKVSSPTVSLYKANGTLSKDKIPTKELPQASAWTEWAFVIDFSLYGWGATGDYLTLEFGSEAAKIDINGIHFRTVTKAEYVPQIFTITGFNTSNTTLERVTDTHFIIQSIGTDPNVNLAPLLHGLHPNACMLTFEYISAQTMTNRLQVYYGPGLAESRSTTDRLGTVPPAATWTTRQYDLGADFVTHAWSAKGDWIRMDFGNVSGYKIEIRNIRFEWK